MNTAAIERVKLESPDDAKKRKDVGIIIPDILIKIEKSFQEYLNRPQRIHSLDYICDVYEYSKVMGLDLWLTWDKILNYPTIYDHRLQFIEDTISFITTGKRDMAIENWNRLIDFSDPLVKAGKLDVVKPIPIVFKSIPILDTWIKRDNGVLDLLLSLHIMIMLIDFNILHEC